MCVACYFLIYILAALLTDAVNISLAVSLLTEVPNEKKLSVLSFAQLSTENVIVFLPFCL